MVGVTWHDVNGSVFPPLYSSSEIRATLMEIFQTTNVFFSCRYSEIVHEIHHVRWALTFSSYMYQSGIPNLNHLQIISMVCPSGRWKACGGPFYGRCMSSGLTRTPLSWGGGRYMNRGIFWSEGGGKGIQSWLLDKLCIPHSQPPTRFPGTIPPSLHPLTSSTSPPSSSLRLFLWMSPANKTSPFPSIHALHLQPLRLFLSFSPSQTTSICFVASAPSQSISLYRFPVHILTQNWLRNTLFIHLFATQ